jgi:hypothetical protein
VSETTEKTKAALAALVGSAAAAQKPKNLNINSKREATYVRYTPANQMGDNSKKQDRIMKIVERQKDPMEPPKFKHKKIPRVGTPFSAVVPWCICSIIWLILTYRAPQVLHLLYCDRRLEN